MKYTLFAAACAALLPVAALALVPAEEAAKLKTTLTPLGAERAGNPEGTIPAWTGGATEAPAGYKSGEPRPDPFPNEKPRLVINAAKELVRLPQRDLILWYPSQDHPVRRIVRGFRVR